MSGFYYGHAAGADWREAADRSLQQLGTNGGTLGFLYVTDVIADHYADVLDLMREKTGVAHWVGATGIGVTEALRALVKVIDGASDTATTRDSQAAWQP